MNGEQGFPGKTWAAMDEEAKEVCDCDSGLPAHRRDGCVIIHPHKALNKVTAAGTDRFLEGFEHARKKALKRIEPHGSCCHECCEIAESIRDMQPGLE